MHSLRASTAPPPNSNLYCAQCDAQIGIFENEWVRLTASYARSKEKGTHFGTEVGTRTQLVPAGSSQKEAEGCEMSEVFCKKCSSLVGQFCKSAPNREKQRLVDHYFYKLSRIYLKDSNTSTRVEPAFALDSPDFGQVLTGNSRSHMASRSRLSSVARSSFTPLRQSFPPGPLRASPFTAGNDRENDDSPPNTTRPASSPGAADVSRELTEHSNAINNCADQLKYVDVRTSNQGQRIREHEERLGELEYRFINYETRSREMEKVISAQRERIYEQEQQLDLICKQYETLQNTMRTVQKSLDGLQSGSAGKGLSHTQIGDVFGNFETLLQTMRDHQAGPSEMKALREQNEAMRAQLNIISTKTGLTSESSTLATGASASSSTLQNPPLLGKRKRNDHNRRLPSLDLGASSSRSTTRTMQSAQQGEAQVPTPGSSQAAEQSPINDNDDDAASTGDRPRQAEERGASIAETDMDAGPTMDLDLPDPVQSSNRSSTVKESQPAAHQPSPILGSAQTVSNVPCTFNSLHQSEPESAAVMNNDETIDFSDDEQRPRPTSSAFVSKGIETRLNDRPARDVSRRLTDNVVPDRDNRSMAPEPSKRRKQGESRRHTGGINLEKIVISTPDMYDGVVMRNPRSIRPPVPQSREIDLNDELRRLGLSEWIGKDKNNQTYRDALDAARTRERQVKRAEQLHSHGLSQNLPSEILAAVQNRNGATMSTMTTTFKNMYADPYLQGVLKLNKPSDKPKRVRKSTEKAMAAKEAMLPTSTAPVVQETQNEPPQTVDNTSVQPQTETSTASQLPDMSSADVDGEKVMHPRPTPATDENSHKYVAEPPKRGRGRPRKSKDNVAQVTAATDQAVGEAGESEDDCAVCGKRGKLLCCDGCPKVYHHKCLNPPMDPKSAVEGDWYCPPCRERREAARPLQVISPNARAQREKAIMERDRLAREAMEREEMTEARR